MTYTSIIRGFTPLGKVLFNSRLYFSVSSAILLGMNSVVTFFKGVWTEAKKTTWLSPTEALGHTAIVVVISVAVGFYLGFWDGIFNKILQNLIAR